MASKGSSRGRHRKGRQPASIQLNRSLTSRHKEKKAASRAKKAEYLASLPKDRWKRLAVRLGPRHLVEYWFSRDGAIMALKIIGIFIFVCFFVVIGLFAYFRKDILAFKSIDGANLGGSISYYDRTGTVLLWQDYNSVKRIPVSFNQISPYMKEATVAIEDKNFYHESGFDFLAILRSAVHDVIHHGQGLEGASTITEQVVKLNKGWKDPLTLTEKVEEIGLAIELSREYSKAQILNAYLNIAPYGNVDYGVQAAAQDYFHTTAAKLTLAQSAMLASIPQAPTAYSPFSSPTYNSAVSANYFAANLLTERAHYVLQLMAQQHYITEAQAQAAMKVNVLAEVHPLQSQYNVIKYPYFDLAAKQQLLNTYGQKLMSHGTWKVITTLSVPLQNLAQNVVASNANNALYVGGADEEALVAEQTQTGQVVAYVGGENFNNPIDGQINYAALNINPGSTIKPYVYSTFINNSHDAGAGSVIYDVQQPLPGYPCTNKALPQYGGNCLWDYDFRYPGPETLRYALAGSRNVPAVKIGLMAGISNVQKTASAMMGFPNAYVCYAPNTNPITDGPAQQVPCYGSAAIGNGYLQLDHTVNGLATLGRMGVEVPQTYILQIIGANGNPIYQWHQPKGTQVIRKDTAYILNNMLSDPRATYLPGSCTAYTCTQLSQGGYKWQRYNGWDIAVKTGTQNSDMSGLMAGWTTQYTVISWAGYHTINKPLKLGTMEAITEPMTRGWLQSALDMLHTKPINWVQPKDIKVIPAYVQRVHVGLGSEEPGPVDELFPSWYTGKGATGTRVIDKVSGGLATACTPPDARETVTGGTAASFSVDKFWPINQSKNGSSSSAPVYDNVHKCSDQPPSVSFINPTAGSNTICSNTDNNGKGCSIVINATAGTHPLAGGNVPGAGTLSLSINGSVVQTWNLSNTQLPVVYYYLPPPSDTSPTTVNLSATVTDSVLYQNTATAQLSAQYSGNNSSPSPSSTTSGPPPPS